MEAKNLRAVRRSVVLPAPVEAVWAALTEQGHLSAWLGGEVELEAVPGGQIVVREDGRIRRGVVVDLEALRHLEIRWLPPARRVGFIWGSDDEPAGSGGEVEFFVDALPEFGGTVLTVVERAPATAMAAAR